MPLSSSLSSKPLLIYTRAMRQYASYHSATVDPILTCEQKKDGSGGSGGQDGKAVCNDIVSITILLLFWACMASTDLARRTMAAMAARRYVSIMRNVEFLLMRSRRPTA